MADKIRVVHYLNQFFAQFGGEEIADIAPGFKDGPIGPGRALSKRWGRRAKSSLPAFAATTTSPNIWKKLRRNCFAKWRVSNPNCLSRDLPSKAGATASLAARFARRLRSDSEFMPWPAWMRKTPEPVSIARTSTSSTQADSVVRMPPVLQRMAALGLKLVQGHAAREAGRRRIFSSRHQTQCIRRQTSRGTRRGHASGKNSRRAVQVRDCCAAIPSHQTRRSHSRLVLSGYRAGHRRRPCDRGQSGADGAGPPHSFHHDRRRRHRPVGLKGIRRRAFRL